MNGSRPNHAYIAGEGGRLYRYDLDARDLTVVFQERHEEPLMGLARGPEHLFVGSDSQLFKFRVEDDSLREVGRSKKFPGRKYCLPYKLPNFHQMGRVNDRLYMSVTRMNQIWTFDLDLRRTASHRIRPPRWYLPVSNGSNYNHLNHVYHHEGRFYVTLNWLTGKQYGPSGVGVFDRDFRELDRFEYGWELHKFEIHDDRRIALCGSSGAIKEINHPHRAGLMVDGSFAFEHDPDHYFNKDWALMPDGGCLVVGGEIDRREKRIDSDAVIFHLDADWNLVDKITFEGTGGFRGILVPASGDEAADE